METVFAHRGASFEAPENTIPAFELALEQGCKAIELDVQLTLDQHIVVFHDDTIDRTTDGTGYVKDQTLASLKKRDAGSWFSSQFIGTSVPTLKEVLEMIPKDVLVNIEIKNIPFFHKGIEEKIIETIDYFGFEDNILISSYDHHALKTIQAIRPHLKIGVLLANHLVEPWKYIHYAGIQAYSIHPIYTFVNENFVKQSHDRWLKVFPFTVDDRKVYQYYTELGVDGIFTNIPSRFIS